VSMEEFAEAVFCVRLYLPRPEIDTLFTKNANVLHSQLFLSFVLLTPFCVTSQAASSVLPGSLKRRKRKQAKVGLISCDRPPPGRQAISSPGSQPHASPR
jgi:hypothetical protein